MTIVDPPGPERTTKDRRWLVSCQIDRDEIGPDSSRLSSDTKALEEWVGSLEDLLPTHACRFDGLGYKWTTPLGGWRLLLDVRGFGSVRVSVKGPAGEWVLADHRAPYVESFLRLVGAIW